LLSKEPELTKALLDDLSRADVVMLINCSRRRQRPPKRRPKHISHGLPYTAIDAARAQGNM
jgi:hypothetical protein